MEYLLLLEIYIKFVKPFFVFINIRADNFSNYFRIIIKYFNISYFKLIFKNEFENTEESKSNNSGYPFTIMEFIFQKLINII